ncbi:uncharacterized protein BDZ83DRAFT_798095 [Colletotrichum acutatum]|uniref:Uncharacterized protein n=1 Tax=Glomerella acutata TaxID=27357 RepID=A0AAD8X7M9_GLOAC|nr:uncharacterized protein BDZ83DRAFT_798095 [Colletotrichum acutatum]KAK1704308.1 hypothetical protein BDZ83DRAFT_798095 [Colletotrichum acutatum]
MQFSNILLAALATAGSTVMAAHCAIGSSYFCEADTANYCTNVKGPGGVMVSTTCDADCCNTLNGWGTGCPK